MKKRVTAAAVVMALATAALLVGTADDYGLTLDEPVYVNGADRVARWFRSLSGPDGLRGSLRDERLLESWVFARPENYNLPVPVLISSLGRQLSYRWLSPLSSYRFGHCLLMAATVSILFAYMASSHGWEVALVTCGSLLFMPRIFAHAHLSATDVPVSCFWILAILAWLRSESSWRAGLLTAVLCGVGLATKATFVLLPVLLGAWTIAFRRWSWWRAGLMVLLISPLVMLALCPMWWAAPLARSMAYFRTVFRADAVWKIEVYYLGKTYTGSLPWHNAFVLPTVTTPPWTLALVSIALALWWRARDVRVGLWIMAAGVLPLLRMLPNTPSHDGIRLMMPSIFCLAPLAGFGFDNLAGRSGWLCKGTLPRCIVVMLLLAAGAVAVVSMHPYEMSYYSEVIGGLAGAERLGFEVSYWFDGYTSQAIEEIQRRLPHGVRVWTYPRYEGYPLLRAWGIWRTDLLDGDIGDADYLVLYTRKSRFYAIPGIEQTYAHGKPLWSLKCRGVQVVGLYKL